MTVPRSTAYASGAWRSHEPPKVAIFAQDLADGGAERVLANIANGLVQSGVSVDLVLVRHSGKYLDQLDRGVRVVCLGTERVLKSIVALKRYLERAQPNAMLSALPHVNIAAIIAAKMARSRTKVVVSEHSYPSYARRYSGLRLIRFAYRIVPVAYRLADAVVAVSDGVANDLVDTFRVPRRKVYRIYNPIVTDEEILAPASVPHPWLAKGAPPVVLGIGRLAPVKDFDTLIRAFAILRKSIDARLIILGEGGLRGALEQTAVKLGIAEDVLLPGFVSDPTLWLSRAAVFVSTSVSESFGNAIVEALACGIPVVATDCPCGPREILEGGKWGALVPVGDADAVAGALMSAIASPPEPSALKARARQFGITASIQRYNSILTA